jgi:phosphoribosylformylglycinamidine cyclo-ligase
MSETYRAAGVDIDAGDLAVERIKPLVAMTRRPEVIGGIGGFGGLFAADALGPGRMLVATTDGVGTKATIARRMARYDTIGLDLVAMCVDDLVCQGAEPLFLLDYLAVGSLDPDRAAAIVGGVAEGCRQAGCALLGGEMAEHPGVMEPDEFDLAGFAVGVVDREHVVTGERIAAGDVLVGLASPNLRANGFSLARRVLLEVAGRDLHDAAWDGATRSLGEVLLDPSLIYAPVVRAVLAAHEVRGIVHVTGGGLPGNLPRILPEGLGAAIDRSAWERPRIMAEIQRLGGVADDELARVFNCGVGMVLVVPPAEADAVLGTLAVAGTRAWPIGEVRPGGIDLHGAWQDADT